MIYIYIYIYTVYIYIYCDESEAWGSICSLLTTGDNTKHKSEDWQKVGAGGRQGESMNRLEGRGRQQES